MTETSASDRTPDETREATLEEYLTALLDEVGAPAEKGGEPLTLQQRHAHMMGRYAEIISQHRVALIEAERSQRSLLTVVRRVQRDLKRGEVAKATGRLTLISTVATATKALRA